MGINCNGKAIPNRQTEGAGGETRDKGENNLMTFSGTRRQEKKYVLEYNWQEVQKDETEDELKMRRPSEMVKRLSSVREV